MIFKVVPITAHMEAYCNTARKFGRAIGTFFFFFFNPSHIPIPSLTAGVSEYLGNRILYLLLSQISSVVLSMNQSNKLTVNKSTHHKAEKPPLSW